MEYLPLYDMIGQPYIPQVVYYCYVPSSITMRRTVIRTFRKIPDYAQVRYLPSYIQVFLWI